MVDLLELRDPEYFISPLSWVKHELVQPLCRLPLAQPSEKGVPLLVCVSILAVLGFEKALQSPLKLVPLLLFVLAVEVCLAQCHHGADRCQSLPHPGERAWEEHSAFRQCKVLLRFAAEYDHRV